MNVLKSLILRASGGILHDSSSKVLFYHDIYEQAKYTFMATPLSSFQRHLDVIADNGFVVASNIAQAEKEVQICFDDGFKGIWDCRKLWEEKHWRPTIFIAVELIGKEGYLSREQIKELSKEGFIFQAHGWSHQILTQFSQNELRREIFDSKKYLEDFLELPVTDFCFPVGCFSKCVMDACNDAGYRRMYSSIPGKFYKPVFPNVIRRNLIQFYNEREFKAVLWGGLAPFAIRSFKEQFK